MLLTSLPLCPPLYLYPALSKPVLVRGKRTEWGIGGKKCSQNGFVEGNGREVAKASLQSCILQSFYMLFLGLLYTFEL